MSQDIPHTGRQAGVSGAVLPWRGLILLLLVGLFWGFNWPIMKVGMTAMPVFTFRATAIFFGALCLVAICRYMGYSLQVPRKEWPPLLLVSLSSSTGCGEEPEAAM